MSPITGRCLCGDVSFSISTSVQRIYRCHCSLCQKQTGAAANAATFVDENALNWLTGTELITSYVKESGFCSNFCSRCGSPVPNRLRNTDQFWVPVGLLEGAKVEQVVAHVCSSDKPAWEAIPIQEKQYSGLPELAELKARLLVD